MKSVLKGTFSQAEFAADLSRVHEATATAEYQDAAALSLSTNVYYGRNAAYCSIRLSSV
jgi:hypothetical protein